MASFNKVILVGNLTRDPEVKYLANGTAVADLGLAVNRTWFDKKTNERKEDVTFVDVVLWERQAEVAGEYLSKGKSVLIEGRLQLDSWNDKETGQKRSKLRVVGESMTMLGGKESGGGGGEGGGRPREAGGGSREYGGGEGRGARTGGGAGGRQSAPPSNEYGQESDHGGSPNDEVPF